jgi:TRAP-type C4-dicarboxylate transport system permease large subunit
MDGSILATLAGVVLGFLACTLTCIVCRIWRRNRYYKKVQRSLDEEEAAFQE